MVCLPQTDLSEHTSAAGRDRPSSHPALGGGGGGGSEQTVWYLLWGAVI